MHGSKRREKSHTPFTYAQLITQCEACARDRWKLWALISPFVIALVIIGFLLIRNHVARILVRLDREDIIPSEIKNFEELNHLTTNANALRKSPVLLQQILTDFAHAAQKHTQSQTQAHTIDTIPILAKKLESVTTSTHK